MPQAPDGKDDLGSFEARYSVRRSRAARTVERIALGQDAGLQGYTTLEQAHTLSQCLELGAGSLLLDVGAGRGWPGAHLARAAGCRVLSTDVPQEALREARERAAGWEPSGYFQVLAADGRAFPLRAGAVDAIVHADVFC